MNMKGKEENTITDICYAQKIAHNRYPPQFFLIVITLSFIMIIFSFIYTKKFLGCMYMSSPDRDRLHRSRTSGRRRLVIIILSFLSITITILVFHPSDYIQVPLAHAQQETNNNNSNNIKFVSLSTISTAIGTGAAATGAIVTVPGVMKTRKQSKFLATYLLKIHNEYDELCRKTKTQTQPTDQNKNEYQDFLETLRCDIIYLLQKKVGYSSRRFKAKDTQGR
jgi:NADH:ubiquinone oxidoreductase subunit 5 (subunit L)/multisubunit Na+/H+ antiporter MnhA subunit